MFGKKTMHQEYAKLVAEIIDGQRREPKHVSPKEAWKPGTIDPVDQAAFDDFKLFGATIDWETSGPWSLEETDDTGRRASYLDSPDYGRRWIIFYNAVKIGWLEISPHPKHLFGPVEEFRADPNAQVDISLNWMRFIPYDEAHSFLYTVALNMQGVEVGYDAARDRAKAAAESALIGHMWEIMRAAEEYVPDLDYSVQGTYGVFRNSVAHWQTTGFNPLTAERRKDR
ncbi:MAG: hypothetical protein E5Y02_10335 [Mesorhizobium sp.]|nr:MAG: hypothetical protein E5Y02_10335 [Mesorhizobium sp.]